ncbi:MAG: hypothetical protein M1829_001135 [Trizodia sp. TS-e1964]|nr:MAG: hypothetical protein M1829_001135 [Trizodia sp. TS-e1964]
MLYRSKTEYSDSSVSSGDNDRSSYQSRSSGWTAATSYSAMRSYQYQHEHDKQVSSPQYQDHLDISPNVSLDPRASSSTYASTVESQDDLPDANDPEFEVPDYQCDIFDHEAIPSTPPEFAELFPSTRRLCIHHDDSTIDGNMNLRVDTVVSTDDNTTQDITLFHLRMHDLKSRDFSLRRYCRESGREVCHTRRKYTEPASERRPSIQRSMSNALASFRGKHDQPTDGGIQRHDSGYGSDDDAWDIDCKPSKKMNLSMPTNTTKLEFSNYAHVDIKRMGTKSTKRYNFEYWGHNYAWRRSVRKEGSSKEISYNLVNIDTSAVIAHIVPDALTTSQQEEEKKKGGWIPPCSLWISDEKILAGLTDVAE